MKNWLIKLVALFLLLPFASLSLAAQVTYYDTNNVGTPVAMWDAGARKVWETQYYPFGKEYQTSPAVKDNSRKFIGKEKDKETDLTYFGARYYDDLSGRFLAPDPVRPVNALTSKANQEILDNPQRLNRYAYGLNNPYRYVDPDGESPILVALAIAGAVTSYLSNPDMANAPADSSSPTFESHGGTSIVAGAVGGVGAGKLATGIAAMGASKKTVGRWMSPKELEQMRKTGRVQEGGGGQTRVADPAYPNTYRTPPKGDKYVEFDVPADRVLPHSNSPLKNAKTL